MYLFRRRLYIFLLHICILTFSLIAVPLAANNTEKGNPVEITGEITILYIDDFDHGQGEYRYILKDKRNNRRFNLKFEGEPPAHLRTGAKIKVRGQAKDDEIFLAADGEGGVETLTLAAGVVTGEQKTLVMVVDFLNKSVACPIQDIQDLMFTDPADQSIDDYYRESSLEQISFTGNIVGPYAINFSSTDICDFNAWSDATEALAIAQGVDVNLYDRKVFVFPKENSCGFSGIGQVGGRPSKSWIFRCAQGDIFAHELGHNLGMGHASTPAHEYGDTSDVMGAGGWGLRRINAPHMEQMRWITSENIVTVTQSGIFEIAPLELDSSLTLIPQILKIAKPDSNEYYYLSYRLPLGFDKNLAYSYQRRLTVHRYEGTGRATPSYLLDTLGDGENFNDASNSVRVTQITQLPYKLNSMLSVIPEPRPLMFHLSVNRLMPAAR